MYFWVHLRVAVTLSTTLIDLSSSSLLPQLSLYPLICRVPLDAVDSCAQLDIIIGVGSLLLLIPILVNLNIASKGQEIIIFFQCQLLEPKQNQVCGFPSHCALQHHVNSATKHILTSEKETDTVDDINTRVGCHPRVSYALPYPSPSRYRSRLNHTPSYNYPICCLHHTMFCHFKLERDVMRQLFLFRHI